MPQYLVAVRFSDGSTQRFRVTGLNEADAINAARQKARTADTYWNRRRQPVSTMVIKTNEERYGK